MCFCPTQEFGSILCQGHRIIHIEVLSYSYKTPNFTLHIHNFTKTCSDHIKIIRVTFLTTVSVNVLLNKVA